MSTRVSFARRLALALLRHASRVLPSERSPWADAMQREIPHIENDLQVLRWAAGCLVASYVENMMRIIDHELIRALLAVLVLGQTLSMLFATVLTITYRLHALDAAAFLGRFTSGDDYRRFIPLMDATPWWIHALWSAAAVMFGASILRFLERRRPAFPLFAAAWVFGTAGNLISQSTLAYKKAFSFPAPMFMRDYLVPAVTTLLPLIIAVAFWVHDRSRLAADLSPDEA